MADDPSLGCGATPEHFPPKESPLDWSLVTISLSNHVTHGNSPAVAQGQKQEKRQ
jgi:hypothetical protein